MEIVRHSTTQRPAAAHRRAAPDVAAPALHYKAALQNNVEAQFQLGVAFKRGRGVTANATEAAKWFALSAGQGHAKAQYQMGQMCAEGRGLPKDERSAVHWHKMAAKQEHQWAMYQLGVLYRDGPPALQSASLARAWFTRAAEHGNEKAAQALKEMRVSRDMSRSGVGGR